MTTLVTVIHIIVALALIALVLLQDSKSDGALGMGSSNNANSVLGATGAQTLASKMTMWMAIFFAITCLALTYITSHSQSSVVDNLPLPTAPAAAAPTETPAAATAPAAAAAPTETPAATTAPAAPAQ